MKAASITVPINCPPCGQPYTVHVPVRTEPASWGLAVVVDTDQLTLAVRAHNRQHQ